MLNLTKYQLKETDAFGVIPAAMSNPEDVLDVLYPPVNTDTATSASAQTSSTVPNLTPDDVKALTEQLHVMYLPDIVLSAEDKADLDHICHLTNAEAQLIRLMGNEVETVNTDKWNHDASVQLISLTKSLKGKEIPFSRRADLFDLQPTAANRTAAAKVPGSLNSGKGKERAADNPTPKRSIYHLLPQNAKESWLGAAGEWNELKYIFLQGSLMIRTCT